MEILRLTKGAELVPPEQKALLREVERDWDGAWRAAAPGDPTAAEHAVRELYGDRPPERVVWLDNPVQAAVLVFLWEWSACLTYSPCQHEHHDEDLLLRWSLNTPNRHWKQVLAVLGNLGVQHACLRRGDHPAMEHLRSVLGSHLDRRLEQRGLRQALSAASQQPIRYGWADRRWADRFNRLANGRRRRDSHGRRRWMGTGLLYECARLAPWEGIPPAVLRSCSDSLFGYAPTGGYSWRMAELLHDGQFGDHDELPLYDLLDRMGLYGLEPALALRRVVRNVSWWIPFSRVAFLVRRPTVMLHGVNEDGRLRRSPRFEVHFAGGVRLEQANGAEWERDQIVMEGLAPADPARMPVSAVRDEPEDELRAELIEWFGLARYVHGTGGRRLDQGPDGTLWHADQPIGEPVVALEPPDGAPWRRLPPHVRTMREVVLWALASGGAAYRPDRL